MNEFKGSVKAKLAADRGDILNSNCSRLHKNPFIQRMKTYLSLIVIRHFARIFYLMMNLTSLLVLRREKHYGVSYLAKLKK